MKRLLMIALAFASLCAGPVLAAPIPIKVVILTTFETGADTGDRPGEFQAFAERMPLSQTAVVPGIERPVRYSKDGVLGVVTGMRGRPREAIAALISGGQFDVSKAYWLVAGIAGVDPRAASIGSAAWAQYIVDADPTYEMDEREIPADWPYGIYSLGTQKPGEKGSAAGSSGMAWKLDPGLVAWAYDMTKGVKLDDNADLAAARAGYPSEPNAQKPPFVLIGDALGTARFWHGDRRTQWARDWVKLWTNGAGTFVMSDCEDQGVLDVLTIYGAQGKVDPRRVLVLRTGSNYTRQPDGAQPVLREFTPGGAAAAFEAAYRVAAPVVQAITAGWDRYATALPQGKL
jgi:purine nucleoside permease